MSKPDVQNAILHGRNGTCSLASSLVDRREDEHINAIICLGDVSDALCVSQ